MSLIHQLKTDTNEALKAGDSLRVEVLRGLQAGIYNAKIKNKSKGGDGSLSEDDAFVVLRKSAKERRESIEIYEKASRNELVQKEKEELEVILNYLPKPLNSEEVDALIKRAIEEHGSDDFGKVMKAVIIDAKGRVEAKEVSELVRRLTE